MTTQPNLTHQSTQVHSPAHMAGKLGAKQARPKTQRERDQFALTKIEELLDSAVQGRAIKKWTPQRLRAIEIRYSRLRPQLSAVEVADRREGWSDFLKKIEQHKAAHEISGNAVRIDDASIPVSDGISDGISVTHGEDSVTQHEPKL